MSLLPLHDADGFLYLDRDECRTAGGGLAQEYRSASPFPHIVIDDFLDRDVLRRLAGNFPDRKGKSHFDRDQERLKYQFNPGDYPNGLTRNIFAELNSEAFLTFLTELTGIGGLLVDPGYVGGGLHETCAGGHLSIHTDFNIHRALKVERRLNVLIYLNEDWDSAFGGDLELWDRSMSARERAIAPVLGRAVIFNTGSDSFHGHPDPLTCPPERSRRSIATYYYTALDVPKDRVRIRSTDFRPRAHSAEKRDWRTAYEHWVNDWVPARLQRYARRFGPR